MLLSRTKNRVYGDSKAITSRTRGTIRYANVCAKYAMSSNLFYPLCRKDKGVVCDVRGLGFGVLGACGAALDVG